MNNDSEISKTECITLLHNSTGARYKIHKEIKYQEIIGFGAAFTDSAGINILSLKQATQDLLLK